MNLSQLTLFHKAINFYYYQPISVIIKFMYSGYKVSTNAKSISSMQTKRGLSQTRIQALQKQIDNYTRKIQHEKRKHISIQQNYNSVLKEYQEEKVKLDELKKSNATKEITTLHSKIKSLQVALEKASSVYDSTLSENNKLKCQIDKMRRDKKNYQQIHRNIEQQIRKTDLESNKKVLIIQQKRNRTETLKNQIMSVKQKNQSQKTNAMRQFEGLQKSYLEQKRMREALKLKQKIQKIQITDTQPLLRMRLKKLTAKNMQKMKIIKQYQQNIRKIQVAFEEIKKGSGIKDLQEITNNFIKSEEQNYSLYNYVDVLTQSISSLQDQYKQLQRKISEQETENTKIKKNLMMTPQQRSQRVLEQQKLQHEKAKQLTLFVEDVKPDLQKVLLALARSKYNDNPNRLHDYEIMQFSINERNIEEYLSDLQKYINILVQQKSQHTQDTTQIDGLSLKQKESKYSQVDIRIQKVKGKDDDSALNHEDLRRFAQQYLKEKKNR